MPDWFRRWQLPSPGESAVPTAPAPHPQPVTIGARPRSQVERLRDEAAQQAEEYRQERGVLSRRSGDWTRGIADAARWALGEFVNSPITKTFTGKGVVPDVRTMRDEDYKADWALRHPAEAGVSSAWANGVQHALMWITGDTDDCPV